MSISLKQVVCLGALGLVGLSLGRAALYRFREKEQAIRNACQLELKKTGLARSALKAKYPTPEIHMVSSACLLPGGTGEVVIKGKFVPGTKFVFENDNIEVLKESLAAGEYRATLKAAPGIGPQSAAVTAITPVTAISANHEHAVSVGGKYDWTMNAANGWKMVAHSRGAKACADDSSDGSYEILFFRKGESAPFEKRSASLHHSLYENMYRFTISNEDANAQAGAEDMQTLAREMSNPNLTDAQRQKLMQRIQKAQQQMMANMTKVTDPSYMQKLQAQQQQFGCDNISFGVQAGGFKGTMRCSDKVGTRIEVTGTMTAAR